MPRVWVFIGARRRVFAAAVAIATAIAVAGIAAQQQTPRFAERVDVARIVLDVRVLTDRGDSITGLTADDFSVTIDGKTAVVETATWVGGNSAADGVPDVAPAAPTPAAGAVAANAQGRLVVFLVQKDLEASRLRGLMPMRRRSGEMLATLAPGDRVAVLSFDSHLNVWTDFTDDRARLDRIISHDLLLQEPPVVAASPPPSLIERLDP